MKKLLQILGWIFLLASCWFSRLLVEQAQKYVSQASLVPTKIVVDSKGFAGQLSQSWKALAQGGEEAGPMLEAAVDKIRSLEPDYIRLDHIYDFYHVVSRQDNNLVFNWSVLDQAVDEILATGAKPFFSLSYFPPEIASKGPVSQPDSWEEWQLLVQKTIEHYSGKHQKNLGDVYYEVWNEPDLFGEFKTYGEKNYLTLYEQSALAAQRASDCNQFYLGGPATTDFYPAWIRALLKHVQEKNLKIDFLSFHWYGHNPQDLERNLEAARQLTKGFDNLPIIISEWGSNSQNSPDHDSSFDAVHTVATIAKIVDKTPLAFAFEIKDGPHPSKAFWGRWGILTHENYGLLEKPRYQALKLLNQFSGMRLNLAGQEDNLYALAAKDESIKLLIVNFDTHRPHSQAIEVVVGNLDPAVYQIQRHLYGEEPISLTHTVNENSWQIKDLLPANSFVIFDLKKKSEIFSFEAGFTGQASDRSLVLRENGASLQISLGNILSREGAVEFFLLPDWPSGSGQEIVLFTLEANDKAILEAKKGLVDFGQGISFGPAGEPLNKSAKTGLPAWERTDWHHLVFQWSRNHLKSEFEIFIDGEFKNRQSILNLFGKDDVILKFAGLNAQIDELRVSQSLRYQESFSPPDSPFVSDGQTLLIKHFDGTVE